MEPSPVRAVQLRRQPHPGRGCRLSRRQGLSRLPRGRPLLFFFWVAIWLGVIATVLALIGVAGSHCSKIWIPAWVMSGCFLTVGGFRFYSVWLPNSRGGAARAPNSAPRRSASTTRHEDLPRDVGLRPFGRRPACFVPGGEHSPSRGARL